MTSQDLFDAGDLDGAIRAQTEQVRSQPSDPQLRFVLFSLLCMAGDLERAARQVDALGVGASGPAIEMRTLLYRGLLAAEAERREVWAGRGTPLISERAPPTLGTRLEALGRLAAGDAAGAEKLLDEANGAAALVAGSLNGSAFQQVRDSDDVAASVVEVFAQGRCLWMSFEEIRRLDISAPQDLIELLWLPARLTDAQGSEALVHLPTLYPGTHESDDDRLRLGRLTDWLDVPGAGARGVGQKIWTTRSDGADEDHPLLDVRSFEVAT